MAEKQMRAFDEGLSLSLVQDERSALELAEYLREHRIIAIDFESNGKKTQDPDYKVVGVSFSVDARQAYYIPFAHKTPRRSSLYAPTLKQLNQQQVTSIFRFVWEEHLLVGQNLSYECQALWSMNEKVCYHAAPWNKQGGGIYFDTLVAANLVDERLMNKTLKMLSQHYLNRSPIKYKQALKVQEFGEAGSHDFSPVELDIALAYAAPDASNAFGLFQKFNAYLERHPAIAKVFWDYEMPLVCVTADMETVGFNLDSEHLNEVNRQCTDMCAQLEEEMKTIVYKMSPDFDEQFGQYSANNDEKVSSFLYEIADVPYKEKVDKTALEDILAQIDTQKRYTAASEYIRKLLAYRKVERTRSTYTTSLVDRCIGGKLYPRLNQTKPRSGRYSSEDPNGQNLPGEEDEWDVRKGFAVPYPDWWWVIKDYKAMEFRVAAAVSNCPVLRPIICGTVDIFDKRSNCRDPVAVFNAQYQKGVKDGLTEEEAKFEAKYIDIHTYTASVAYNVSYDDVTKAQRYAAKRVGFGILYGISKVGLAVQINASTREAQGLIDTFMNTYKGVANWIQQVQRFVYDHKYIATLQGRRRRVPTFLYDEDERRYRSVYRWAVNHVIQGTSGYIVKKAMRSIYDELILRNLKTKEAFMIHDEIILVAPTEEKMIASDILKRHMDTELNGVQITCAATEFKKTLSKKAA